MSFSQGQEEETILAYFAGSPAGRFLDIGAYGKTFSNTLRLAELGWGGVCVEPSPAPCAALLALHGGNSAIQVVSAAVAPESGWAEFWDAGGDAVGTLSPAHREKWATAASYRPMHLWTVTVGQLLHKFRPPFRFLSLDVEGMNLPILERLPLGWMETELLVCEHDGQQGLVRHFAGEHGLTEELLLNAENICLAKPKP